MRATEAWSIYIILVLVVFILLTLASNRLSLGVRAFISLVIGALIVLIIAPGVATNDDKSWYGLLILFAFIAPLILGVWLFWTGNMNFPGFGECLVERTVDRKGNVLSESRVCKRPGMVTVNNE